ncbi:hypothetical protein TVAG_309590 [Trichomonas vaginalis G3]|uniref:Uncharacterized protein n=2 Tax=Trichomonas vaginalis (strain ATCC PRA-98 / G3) TaxID=412133 RepID=A2FGD6_TRIV3|nr:ankyrin repeat and EF-Hand domain-containing protein 1 family [Trichomonas vaginalis G3]EAX96040.1 hypothetical protein TVAG_309590 [Trichomonas vaginalis G3]KAI5491751.1 ankyrin repeat and EF-Hand domain-containing protein 1 family [Trichomonas vaginalis G3]|eukprot:XP_001308970.1 hypothetical protein [Trichomonas vaginalis G3]
MSSGFGKGCQFYDGSISAMKREWGSTNPSNPFRSSFQNPLGLAAQRNTDTYMHNLKYALEASQVKSLDEEFFSNDGHVQNYQRFLVPFSVSTTEVPEYLEELWNIQLILQSYDSNNEEQTNTLLNFIENNVYTGVREFETSVFVRPRLVKEYVQLYSKFSKKLKMFIRNSSTLPVSFGVFLTSEHIGSNLEASQLTFSTFQNPSINRLITNIVYSPESNGTLEKIPLEMYEAAISDNVEYFVNITSDSDFNKLYMMDGRSINIIQFLALYGAINCFKFILLNHPKLNSIAGFAVAGGNMEIIRILIHNNIKFDNVTFIPLYFRNDEIFDWIVQNDFTEEQEEKRTGYLYFTETMTIHAILGIMGRNNLINCVDLLSVLYLDGLVDPVRELSKQSCFSINLFYEVQEEEILNNLINNMSQTVFTKILNGCLSLELEDHLKTIVNHENFVDFKMDQSIIDSIKRKFPKIHDLIVERLFAEQTPDKLYKAFVRGLPINPEHVLDAMFYCAKIFDFKTLIKMVEKYYKQLDHNQMSLLLENFPYVWLVIYNEFLSNYNDSKDESIVKLIRYFFTKDIEPTNNVIDLTVLINQNLPILQKLTVFDIVNLMRILPLFDKELMNLLLSKELITQEQINDFSSQKNVDIHNKFAKRSKFQNIIRISSNTIDNMFFNQPGTDLLSKMIKAVAESKKFKEEFFKNPSLLVDIIPNNPFLIDLYIEYDNENDLEKPVFDKLLVYYMYLVGQTIEESRDFGYKVSSQLPTNMMLLFLKVLAKSKYRKYYDLKEMLKYTNAPSFIQYLEFTQEEIDYLKTTPEMKDKIFKNPKNAKYFTVPEILEREKNFITLINVFLVYENLNNESAALVLNEISHSRLSSPFQRNLLNREIFLKNITTRNLINFVATHNDPDFETNLLNKPQPDDISYKVVDEFFSRDFSENDLVSLIVNFPESKQFVEYVLSKYKERLSKDSLILLGCITNVQYVPKNHKINDDYFVKIFQNFTNTKRWLKNLKDYDISVEALTKALHLAANRSDEDNIYWLVRKGALVNTIVNGESFIEKVLFADDPEFLKFLIRQGCDLGYVLKTPISVIMENEIHSPVKREIFLNTKMTFEARYTNKYIIETLDQGYIRTDTIYLTNYISNLFKMPLTEQRLIDEMKNENYNIENISNLMDLIFSQEINFPFALFFLTQITSRFNTILQPFCFEFLKQNLNNPEIENLIDQKMEKASKPYKNIFFVLSSKSDKIEKYNRNTDILFIATKIGNFDVIKSLLENGADINELEGFFYLHSPALEAVSHDRIDLLKLFYEKGLDLNSIYSSDDLTLINCAIEYNAQNCFDFLVDKVELRHRVVQSPMSCALQHLNVNDHYAVVLYEKIDKTVERIESDSFKLFEKCLETNEQFQYNGPLRTTNYQSIGHYGLVLRNSQNYIDLANNSTFVQKSLAFRTFHNRENIGLFINFDPFPYKDAKAKPIPYYPDYDYDDYDDYGGGPDFDEVDEIDFVDDDEVL